jgi:cytochrome c-type biogenesis protein CcmH/NrfF
MLQVDVWDIGALLAVAAVVIGLAVWHWPALLVFAGASFLWVYFKRESRIAARETDQRR